MAELASQRFCPLPAHVALERAVQWLSEHGYQVSARAAQEAQLFHAGGLSPQPPAHRLKVAADGKNLTLVYQAASVFDAAPGPAEEGRLEQLADRLAEAITQGGTLSYREWSERDAEEQPPKAEGPRFCPSCGTRVGPGANACGLCGAAL